MYTLARLQIMIMSITDFYWLLKSIGSVEQHHTTFHREQFSRLSSEYISSSSINVISIVVMAVTDLCGHRSQPFIVPADEDQHTKEQSGVTDTSARHDVDEPHRRRRFEQPTDEQRTDDAAEWGPDQYHRGHSTGDWDSFVDPENHRRESRRHRQTRHGNRRPDDHRPYVDEGEQNDVGERRQNHVDLDHRARPQHGRQQNADNAAGEVASEEDGVDERRVADRKLQVLDGEGRQERHGNQFNVEEDVVEEENQGEKEQIY